MARKNARNSELCNKPCYIMIINCDKYAVVWEIHTQIAGS